MAAGIDEASTSSRTEPGFEASVKPGLAHSEQLIRRWYSAQSMEAHWADHGLLELPPFLLRRLGATPTDEVTLSLLGSCIVVAKEPPECPPSAGVFHRLTLRCCRGPYTAPLLTTEDARMNEETAFLVHAAEVLGPATTEDLDQLRSRALAAMDPTGHGSTISDEHDYGPVLIDADRVWVSRRRFSVPTQRFVELLDGWRSLLPDDQPSDAEYRAEVVEPGSAGAPETDSRSYRCDTAVLTAVARRELRYRLADGSLTASAERAAQDLTARLAAHRPEWSRALRALAAAELSSGSLTPARMASVQALVDAAVLPPSMAMPLLRAGRVGDPTWEALRPLRWLETPQLRVQRWSIALRIDGRPHDLPPAHRPGEETASPLPQLRAITQLLLGDGWEEADIHTLDVPDHELTVPIRRVVLTREPEPPRMPWSSW